jgi:hypothetical protein
VIATVASTASLNNPVSSPFSVATRHEATAKRGGPDRGEVHRRGVSEEQGVFVAVTERQRAHATQAHETHPRLEHELVVKLHHGHPAEDEILADASGVILQTPKMVKTVTAPSYDAKLDCSK